MLISLKVLVFFLFSSIVLNATIVKKTGQSISYTAYDDGYYQKGANNSYTRDDTKEIVTDNLTGLVWQDDANAKDLKKTWQEAIGYCEALDFAGQTDWRLPELKELQTIVDDGVYNPSINPAFQNITSYNYWSSTTNASNTSYAWGVNFYNGYSYYSSKTNSLYVRCVRGGQ